MHAFERMVTVGEKYPSDPTLPPFRSMIAYEFIPLKKFCSVPAESTAFRNRGHRCNIISLIAWGKEGGTDIQHASEISRGLKDIIESTTVKSVAENGDGEHDLLVNIPISLILNPQNKQRNFTQTPEVINHLR